MPCEMHASRLVTSSPGDDGVPMLADLHKACPTRMAARCRAPKASALARLSWDCVPAMIVESRLLVITEWAPQKIGGEVRIKTEVA